MSPATGPHSFTDEHGKEWRVVGPYEHVPGYAEIRRVEDDVKSVRPIAVLGPAGLSMPGTESAATRHLISGITCTPSVDGSLDCTIQYEDESPPTAKTRVVNRKTGEPFDVDVGRPGPWGNPYSHLPGTSATYVVGSRAETVELYRAWLKQRIMAGEPGLVEALAALHGQTLGCYCAPEPCHGDVLVAASEWAVHELEARA